jgi:hypothetical protein
MYKHVYLSIDPGTAMLGTTINAITMNDQYVVLHSCTTNIELVVRHTYPTEQIMVHGERFFKNMACARVVDKFATAWWVNDVVSESPYMGRFPQAFGALTECMAAMRNALYVHNPNRALHTIDPSTIKKSVGVSGKSGDKELMRQAVQRIAGSMVNVDWLDEHAIDSIAVGYAWYRSVWMGQSI